jgi:hypothetical protein
MIYNQVVAGGYGGLLSIPEYFSKKGLPCIHANVILNKSPQNGL